MKKILHKSLNIFTIAIKRMKIIKNLTKNKAKNKGKVIKIFA